MLCMKVCLGAVRARKLAVRILLRNLRLRVACSGSGCRRASRSARQNSTPSLRADDVSRLIALRKEHGRLGHEWALAVRRVHAGLRHHASRRHGPEDRRHTPTRGWRRGDRLRMDSCSRGLRHHGRSGRISLLLLLVWVVRNHLVTTTPGSLTRRGRRIRGHVVRTRGIRSCWSSRTIVVTSIRVLLHSRVAWLKRG